MMTFSEKRLYHQIYLAKLLADISASILQELTDILRKSRHDESEFFKRNITVQTTFQQLLEYTEHQAWLPDVSTLRTHFIETEEMYEPIFCSNFL